MQWSFPQAVKYRDDKKREYNFREELSFVVYGLGAV